MTSRSNENALAAIRGGLVVSCQAYPGEPMRTPLVMAAVAQAVVLGGAKGVRAQGLNDLRAIRALIDIPLIGLVKRGASGVFITPTVEDATDCVAAGSNIVALDGTRRPRPDGRPLHDSIDAVHRAGGLVMADCGSLDDARYSIEAGADCLGTTLAGYSDDRPVTIGPDFALLADLIDFAEVPVIAEGRVRSPDDAVACLVAGAHAVVVGTAITHPTRITQTYVDRIGALR